MCGSLKNTTAGGEEGPQSCEREELAGEETQAKPNVQKRSPDSSMEETKTKRQRMSTAVIQSTTSPTNHFVLTSVVYPAGNDRRQSAWLPQVPVCELGDVKTCRSLLAKYGVVVFRGVLSAAAVAQAEGLFWDWLERHTTARRSKIETHTSAVFSSLGYPNTGVINNYSIGQSTFLWHCRMAAESAWRTVWDDDDLITSFDGAGCWRNPYVHTGNHVFTDGNWYHLDQNVNDDPGFLGYQGLVPTSRCLSRNVFI